MNVNCVNIEREEESLNITNINLLVRFNKTREIFPSVTRVLSIFLTTAATSASVERGFQFPAMRKSELSAVITKLMSKCL